VGCEELTLNTTKVPCIAEDLRDEIMKYA
jgi:hypothetical protein